MHDNRWQCDHCGAEAVFEVLPPDWMTFGAWRTFCCVSCYLAFDTDTMEESDDGTEPDAEAGQ